MKLKDAIKLRDKERETLVGTIFSKKDDGWKIRDVIVASRTTVANVYTKMWDGNVSNETALQPVSIKDDDYDVFVISHQWNWGSGHLLFQQIDEYRKAN